MRQGRRPFQQNLLKLYLNDVGMLTYMPIYYIMFIDATGIGNRDIYF